MKENNYIEDTIQSFRTDFPHDESCSRHDNDFQMCNCYHEQVEYFLKQSIEFLVKRIVVEVNILKEEGRAGSGWTQDGSRMVERIEELKSIILRTAGIDQ